MRVLVLGGSGSIGRLVLEQGLRQGHEFTVLLRDPAKLEQFQNRVRLLPDDALNPDALGAPESFL